MSQSITKKLLAGLTSAAMLATATAVNLTAVPAATAADTKVIYSTDFEGDSFDFTRRGEDETLELTTEQAHGRQSVLVRQHPCKKLERAPAGAGQSDRSQHRICSQRLRYDTLVRNPDPQHAVHGR